MPNIDDNNHVFKIICGAGWHSTDGAKLKKVIPVILKNQGYEFYTDEEYFKHGNYLVRFQRDR